jgi:hypothetical protein
VIRSGRPFAGIALAGLLAASACTSARVATPSVTTSSTPTTSALVPDSTTSSTRAPASIPPKYQLLYDTLSAGLDAYQRAVDALAPASTGTAAPVLATELLPANGNRLAQLLLPATMVGVDRWLDRLQSMGIRGVTLGVKLPMLLPEFGPDGEAYTTFFAAVADKARAHQMTVDVELGALFCGTVFAACSHSFAGGYGAFVDATVAQARIVIDRVKPDYLTILSEPTTEASLAKVTEFATPAGAARYVHDVVAGIGNRGSTKVGAGAATWLDPSFNAAILRESIDYLTLHIYPVTARTTDYLMRDTKLAQAAGKPIVADEVGLYKTDGSDDTTPATADTAFRRDMFSFFEPLDVRFATITSAWARKSGVAYVSPYWAGELFSYIAWTPALDIAPYAQLAQAFNAQVSQAFVDQKTTDYARAWLRTP